MQSPVLERNAQAIEERVRELGLGMPFMIDRGGLVAQQAGIYATPQALLLSVEAGGSAREQNEEARIVYRGNYNTSRYCTDPRTEFVRIALTSLLSTHPVTVPETLAYGCELPKQAVP